MLFAALQTAPGVERVVHDNSMLQHFVVIGKVGGKTVRNRKQAVALRRQVRTRRVGAAHDRGQMIEGSVFNTVGADDGVERATVADMSEFDTLDVIGGATEVGSHLGDLV